MDRRTRIWFLTSLALFVAAWCFWQWGNDRQARLVSHPPDSTATPPAANRLAKGAVSSVPAPTNGVAKPRAFPANQDPQFPYRLANTSQTMDQLVHNDHAILLRNALVDTTLKATIKIPEVLKSNGDPGRYVVQARGQLNDTFRSALKAVHAEIVCYIPNNAYLVQMAADGAKSLAMQPMVQSVLPWEPYYKLESHLLAAVLDNQPLPGNPNFNLVLFPGQRQAANDLLKQTGAESLGEQRTPFGQMLVIKVHPAQLATLARNPLVQAIELNHARKPVNDIGRQYTGVSTNTTLASPAGNYKNLTGNGVSVSINDTGVDSAHPDLAGRVDGLLVDFDGHGTHVAGTIAGNGSQSGTINTKFIPGSATNGANFRGMAPAARLFCQSIFFNSDTTMQENAALTNALVSNNSWGYTGSSDYDFASASYDAAVRDALPGMPGEQAITYVFAAGNEGLGDDNGTGGVSGTIISPATGKNVITVGATEEQRYITNLLTFRNMTDSKNQVAGFSSRGNVGIGIEGLTGRFKPDVVAPGTFVLSCRASAWVPPATNIITRIINFPRRVVPNTNDYINNVYVPLGGVSLGVYCLPNAMTIGPLDLTVNIYDTNPPAVMVSGNNSCLADTTGRDNRTWVYKIHNNNPNTNAYFDLRIAITYTNYDPLLIQHNVLDDTLKPWYRFETGTSMATPMVSGLCALFQEYFQTRFGHTNSPALNKALLVNAARSFDSYSLSDVLTANAAGDSINYQGWGAANITNALPMNMGSVIEQSSNTVLQTGDSLTYNVTVGSTGSNIPVRFTLVWTDPPGNPMASLKLVNDLDLVVSDGTNVYYGNNFEGNFCAGISSLVLTNLALTNQVPDYGDKINNVENVFIEKPGVSTFAVTVRARRVAVNAVNSNTNTIGQDFVLVVSAGDASTNSITISSPGLINSPLAPLVSVESGVPLLHQRIGAHPPLLYPDGIQNGVLAQWNFYVFTNSPTNSIDFTNVAFFTFMPPNLSRWRNKEADIDLYVSQDSALTNLNPGTLSSAYKAVGRGGTEYITFINSSPGQVYYVGVKAEDQMGAEYGFYALATNQPFDQTNDDGSVLVFGSGGFIPDGTPDKPGQTNFFALMTRDLNIKRVVVTNTFSGDSSQNFGDILAYLTHPGGAGSPSGPVNGDSTVTEWTNEQFAVLSAHTFVTNSPYAPGFNAPVTYTMVYDDSDEMDIPMPPSSPTDPPGSLNRFINEQAQGVWMVTAEDNAPTHVSSLVNWVLKFEPNIQLTNDASQLYTRRIRPLGFQTYSFFVPPGVTNLTVWIYDNANPLELYIRRGAPATRVLYDKMRVVPSGGGSLSVGIYDTPPLSPGLYYVGVYNPNTVEVTYKIGVELDWALSANFTMFTPTYPTNAMAIMDDTITNSYIFVPVNQQIADVMVDVRADHPRLSDLSLHLVSPTGTRLMLFENRGGWSATNMGSVTYYTNWLSPTTPSGTAKPDTNSIAVNQNSGYLIINYQFFGIPDDIDVYLYGINIFSRHGVSGGGTFMVPFTAPIIPTTIDIVMNQSGGNSGTAWNYQPAIATLKYNYLTFTENTNLARLPIKFVPPPFDPPFKPALTNRLYVLPEEPMKAVVGETAFGWWRLEVWDNRAGNPSTNAFLQEWNLHLALVNLNPLATPLTNRVDYTMTLLPNQIWYFMADMPVTAQFATNTLIGSSASSRMDLWFNQAGLPDGSQVLLTNVPAGVSTLDNQGLSVPQVAPGQRYFLAVTNRAATNETFTIRVDFDIPVYLLTTNAPVTHAVAPYPAIDYYQLDVPTNMASMVVETVNANGDVALLLSQAITYPDLWRYQYISDNLGTNDEQIVVPYPRAGRWYVGVANHDTNAVTYTLRVTFVSSTSLSASLYQGKLLRFVGAPAYRVANHSMALSFEARIGFNYTIQVSSNLTDWQTLTNLRANQVNAVFLDPTPRLRQKYYRITPTP
ncbi:MAG: S8 family serine peptidase [Verrucomicrobiota bacterium]